MTSNIAELFRRDPTQLSDQDLTAIVAKLRELRSTFMENPAAVRARKKKDDVVAESKISNLIKDLGI